MTITRVLGRLTRRLRAGETYLAWNDPATRDAPDNIILSSPSFGPDGTVSRRYAGPGVGDNLSPMLSWSNLPIETAELVLIVEDPDAPLPRPFVHGIVASIPPAMLSLAEGALSPKPAEGMFTFGKNTFGRAVYTGPRAVPGHGPHSYIFQLFALDRKLAVLPSVSRKHVLKQMEGAVLARGRITGVFER